MAPADRSPTPEEPSRDAPKAIPTPCRRGFLGCWSASIWALSSSCRFMGRSGLSGRAVPTPLTGGHSLVCWGFAPTPFVWFCCCFYVFVVWFCCCFYVCLFIVFIVFVVVFCVLFLWFVVGLLFCVLCLRAICRLVVVGRRGSPLACRLLRGDGAVAVWWPRPSCMSHTAGVVRGVCRSRRREPFVIVLCFAVSFAFAAALVRRSMVFRRRLFGRGL